jgi:quinoprotein glucose dehydrogenase
VAVAMARVAGPGAGGNLAATLAADDGKDRVLHDGLVRALEMLGKPGIDALISVADSGVQKDTDHVATTFLGLRTRAAFDALPRLLKNPHLSTAQRVALVESTLNYHFAKPLSFEAIIAAVASNAKESDEVRVAVLKALVACGAATGPKTTAFVVAQLGNNNLDVRAAALKTAGALRVTAASAVLVKALAGELSPEERLATVEALRHAGVKEMEVWEAVRRQLRDGSPSLKRESLRTLAILHPETALAEAKAFLLDKDAKLQREAVVVSGLSAAGAKRVGHLWQEGKLPKTLRAAVVAALTAWAKKDAKCAKLLEAMGKSAAKE